MHHHHHHEQQSTLNPLGAFDPLLLLLLLGYAACDPYLLHCAQQQGPQERDEGAC